MRWYLNCIKKYVNFSGRASRKEYWMFFLFNILFSFAAVIIDVLFGTLEDGLGVFSCIYSLAVFLPGLAVTVRRLHDINRSGFAIFISLIPLIGGIILLVWMVSEGNVGENNYGPEPYYE